MMKANIVIILLACLICTAALWTGCILEDKVVQIVITDNTSADFSQSSESENFATTIVVDYAEKMDEILADNDIARENIDTAILVSASYGVTSFEQDGDWEITGAILVKRQDISIAQDTLITYTSQSIRGALGKQIPARLHAAGVGILNQALSQYLAGTHNPIIEFTMINGDVEPNPSPGNPIVFDWKSWLTLQVILSETFEVPDPF